MLMSVTRVTLPPCTWVYLVLAPAPFDYVHLSLPTCKTSRAITQLSEAPLASPK